MYVYLDLIENEPRGKSSFVLLTHLPTATREVTQQPGGEKGRSFDLLPR